MSKEEIYIIANYALRAIVFICVTVAAIYFKSVGVLWWYIVPLLMSITIKF